MFLFLHSCTKNAQFLVFKSVLVVMPPSLIFNSRAFELKFVKNNMFKSLKVSILK